MEYEKKPISELGERGGPRAIHRGVVAAFRLLTDGEMMFVPTPDGRDMVKYRATLYGTLYVRRSLTGLKPHTSIDREKGGVWVWHDPRKAADA